MTYRSEQGVNIPAEIFFLHGGHMQKNETPITQKGIDICHQKDWSATTFYTFYILPKVYRGKTTRTIQSSVQFNVSSIKTWKPKPSEGTWMCICMES